MTQSRRAVVVSVDSPVPLFEQIRSQLATAIEHGELAPASRLPTVRTLAAELGVAANTIARAFKELELAGLIETRGRYGTFVAGHTSAARASALIAARAFVARAQQLGLGEAESLAIVRREIEAGAVAGWASAT